jgi:hypothetical protein
VGTFDFRPDAVKSFLLTHLDHFVEKEYAMDLTDKPRHNPDHPVDRMDEDLLADHPRGEISRLRVESYPDQATQIHADLPDIPRTFAEYDSIGPA